MINENPALIAELNDDELKGTKTKMEHHTRTAARSISKI